MRHGHYDQRRDRSLGGQQSDDTRRSRGSYGQGGQNGGQRMGDYYGGGSWQRDFDRNRQFGQGGEDIRGGSWRDYDPRFDQGGGRFEQGGIYGQPYPYGGEERYSGQERWADTDFDRDPNIYERSNDLRGGRQGYGQGFNQGHGRGYGVSGSRSWNQGMRSDESAARDFDQGSQGAERDEFDPDYHQWRSEQVRRLDDDYRSWRQDRYKKFSEEFDKWRSSRSEPAGNGARSASKTETGGGSEKSR